MLKNENYDFNIGLIKRNKIFIALTEITSRIMFTRLQLHAKSLAEL